MSSTLKLSGVDEFLRELEALAPGLTGEAGPLEAALAEQTAAEIRAGVPVATGALRASVQTRRLASAGSARVATEVTVGVDYAAFVEFGTPLRAPQPVFVPAVRRGREAFVKAIIGRVRARGLTVGGEAP